VNIIQSQRNIMFIKVNESSIYFLFIFIICIYSIYTYIYLHVLFQEHCLVSLTLLAQFQESLSLFLLEELLTQVYVSK
jgi:hypothetical protein